MDKTPLPIGTKYKLADKQKRNNLVRAHAKKHPKLKLRELAALFGISIPRIWAILRNGKK